MKSHYREKAFVNTLFCHPASSEKFILKISLDMTFWQGAGVGFQHGDNNLVEKFSMRW